MIKTVRDACEFDSVVFNYDAMIPEELSAVSKTLWPELTAAERFYVRMLKMEKEG